jgi:hypothetical protein
VQAGKKIRLSQPQQMMAQDRKIVEEAYAGDIIGVFDPGIFSIGDTVCAPNEHIEYEGIPTFAPEHFAKIRQVDTMKRKQFIKGVSQIAQEGAIQIFQEFNTGMEEIIVGVVGVLQFDVLRFRLESEYGVEIRMDPLPYEYIRWIENDGYRDTNSEDKADCQISYEYLADGNVDMIVKVTPKHHSLRRVGVAAELDAKYSNVNYYGYGPYENYPDRMAGVLVGNYDAKVVTFNEDGTLPQGSLMEPYMKPQTTGDRLVYSVTLTDDKGEGWQIECPEGIYFSANRYTDEDFMNTKHTWELKARPYIWLQLGMDIRGLGNASCGPGPMQKYLIDSNKTYEFRVRMKKIQ